MSLPALSLYLSYSASSGSPGEIRVSLLQNGELLDTGLWRPGRPDGWQDVHLVRVKTKAPALDGAFVVLDSGEEGFLALNRACFRDRRRSKPAKPEENKPFFPAIEEGSLLKARLVRPACHGKGIRLHPLPVTQEEHLALQKETAPICLERGPNILEALAESAPDSPVLLDDTAIVSLLPPSLLARLQPRLRPLPVQQKEDWRGMHDDDWDRLLQADVPVGPLLAHITPTPALIAIDLDHKGISGQSDFEANIAAFPLLLRQIRLRNLSGTILIDPAGVKSRKRPALVSFLEKAMKEERDPLKPVLKGITPSGLLEIMRPRHRPALHELMTSPHGKALSILRQIMAEYGPRNPKEAGVNRPGYRPDHLQAPAGIIHALQKDPVALEDFARQYGRILTFSVSEPDPAPYWRIS